MNADLVKNKMLELGLSKELFAVKVGCSVATVYNMLAGQRVSDKTAYNAAKVLGVKVRDLVTAKEPA